MCGGGSQEVTQRTELDPSLQRLLYGGALGPAHGLTGIASAAPAARSSGASSSGSSDDGMWSDGMTASQVRAEQAAGTFGRSSGSSRSPQDAYNDQMSRYESSGGGISVGYGSSPVSAMSDAGDAGFAMGGPVQSGIGSMQPNMPMTQNMPTMNGALPNLSNRELAATLAMAQMRPQMMAGRGAQGAGMPQQNFAMGGMIEGPGTGTSDSIPATIYQNGVPVQDAALSDGEFVMTERAVKGAGNGDREAGAARMYEMMKMFERGGRV